MQKRILAYQTGLTEELHDIDIVSDMTAKLVFGDKLFSVNAYFKRNTNELPVKKLNHPSVSRILNSIVKDGIAHFESETKKIRRAMRYILCCNHRGTEFSKRCLADKHLIRSQILDIPTRWNTTCDMLVCAFHSYRSL